MVNDIFFKTEYFGFELRTLVKLETSVISFKRSCVKIFKIMVNYVRLIINKLKYFYYIFLGRYFYYIT